MWRVEQRDAGMSTVEYAVGTFAAAAFAMVLWRVVNSEAVFKALTDIIGKALTTLVISGTAAW